MEIATLILDSKMQINQFLHKKVVENKSIILIFSSTRYDQVTFLSDNKQTKGNNYLKMKTHLVLESRSIW